MRPLTVCALALAGLLFSTSSASAQGAGDPAAATAPKPTVNLNAAPVEQLDTLPGVGRKMAERIIEYRQKNGGFKKIEELMNVKGIGEKNFLRLKPFVFVPARTEKTEKGGQ
jgi:competence protein ComEA